MSNFSATAVFSCSGNDVFTNFLCFQRTAVFGEFSLKGCCMLHWNFILGHAPRNSAYIFACRCDFHLISHIAVFGNGEGKLWSWDIGGTTTAISATRWLFLRLDNRRFLLLLFLFQFILGFFLFYKHFKGFTTSSIIIWPDTTIVVAVDDKLLIANAKI